MALKRKLTADEWSKLSKDMQKEYWKDGDDYTLDVETGDDDPGELRRARDREKSEASRLRAELKKANDRLAAVEAGDDEGEGEGEGEGGRESPARGNRTQTRRRVRDAATIDQTWKDRHETAMATEKEKQDKLRAKIREREIKGTAGILAAEISTMPTLMAKEIAGRLTVEFDDDDEPTLVILGKNGKPSDMTLEQLKREFVANKEFSGIIIGTKASGGGAPRNGPEQKPGGAVASEGAKPLDLSKMAPKDLAAHLKARKESQEAT